MFCRTEDAPALCPKIGAEKGQSADIEVVAASVLEYLVWLHPEANERPAIRKQHLDRASRLDQPICSHGGKGAFVDDDLAAFGERVSRDGRRSFEPADAPPQAIDHLAAGMPAAGQQRNHVRARWIEK